MTKGPPPNVKLSFFSFLILFTQYKAHPRQRVTVRKGKGNRKDRQQILDFNYQIEFKMKLELPENS